MQRFMTFVNGSNLFTSFKHLDLYIDDYEDLFHYIFEQAVDWWRSTTSASTPVPAQHVRIYWHVVETMDEWDLANTKTRQHLLERFLEDRDVRSRWMAEVIRGGERIDASKQELLAFNQCIDDCRNWYEKRQNVLGGMNRFHHAVEAATDFIELRRCGRWKIDLLHKVITERGLDVGMAVDAVTLRDRYDVAMFIGADPDGMAGIDYLKSQGKQIAVVEMLKGFPTEYSGRGFATPLKLSADFIIPIYEAELLKRQIASKGGNGGETFVLNESL